MSRPQKKDAANEIIEKSIELLGSTPDEISDRNVEWMMNKGYLLNNQRINKFVRDGKPEPTRENAGIFTTLKRLILQQTN